MKIVLVLILVQVVISNTKYIQNRNEVESVGPKVRPGKNNSASIFFNESKLLLDLSGM